MSVLLLVIDWLANAFQNSCSNGPHISGKHYRVSILDQSFSSNRLTSDYSLLHLSRLCMFVLMLSVLSIFPSSPCLLSTNIFSLVVFYDHGCEALRKIEFVLQLITPCITDLVKTQNLIDLFDEQLELTMVPLWLMLLYLSLIFR